jgi:hypothetical protein
MHISHSTIVSKLVKMTELFANQRKIVKQGLSKQLAVLWSPVVVPVLAICISSFKMIKAIESSWIIDTEPGCSKPTPCCQRANWKAEI